MQELENFIARCEANAVPDSEIDLSDGPEMTEADFARGCFKNWKPMKKTITVRIDTDTLSWLKQKSERGYQSRLNAVLRWAMQNNCPLA